MDLYHKNIAWFYYIYYYNGYFMVPISIIVKDYTDYIPEAFQF